MNATDPEGLPTSYPTTAEQHTFKKGDRVVFLKAYGHAGLVIPEGTTAKVIDDRPGMAAVTIRFDVAQVRIRTPQEQRGPAGRSRGRSRSHQLAARKSVRTLTVFRTRVVLLPEAPQ